MITKLIALVDWHWMGHHPTHFVQFAAAIAEAGAKVIPFCVQPDDFTKRLGAFELSEDTRARILSPQKVQPPKASNFRPARWRGIYEARKFFGGLGKMLRVWERDNHCKIDLTFFACIYDREFACFRSAEKLFGFPWSGVYLHARSFHMPGSPIPYTGGLPCPEAIFSSPLMRSAVVRDPRVVTPMQKISSGKPIIVFPETTRTDLPPPGDTSWGLANKMQKLAGGRPIVSLTGVLQWTKGLDEFTELALRREMQEVFFFLGGEVNWTEIEADRKARMQMSWERCENLYAHLQHLPEPTMNSIIAKSDVVFAAYKSFPNISNVVTKSAVFERPIVVSEGYLMAEQVREFRLGLAVSEGDVEGLSAAILRLLAERSHGEMAKQARWADFRQLHSAARLPECFAKIIGAD